MCQFSVSCCCASQMARLRATSLDYNAAKAMSAVSKDADMSPFNACSRLFESQSVGATAHPPRYVFGKAACSLHASHVTFAAPSVLQNNLQALPCHGLKCADSMLTRALSVGVLLLIRCLCAVLVLQHHGPTGVGVC